MPRKVYSPYPTEKQQKVLDIVKAYINKNHFPPAYDEISVLAGYKGRSGCRFHIEQLIKKGYLSKPLAGRRCLVVTEMVNGLKLSVSDG